MANNYIKRFQRYFLATILGLILLLISFALLSNHLIQSNELDYNIKVLREYLAKTRVGISSYDGINNKLGEIRDEIYPILENGGKLVSGYGLNVKYFIDKNGQGDGSVKLIESDNYLSFKLLRTSSGNTFGYFIQIYIIFTTILILAFYIIFKRAFEKKIFVPMVEDLNSRASSHAYEKIARQVSHDINSPLAALESILEDVKSFSPATYNLLRLSISAIKGILSDLKGHIGRKDEIDFFFPALEIERILALNEKIFLEKGFDVNFICSSDNYFSILKCNLIQFQRSIQNLINNAVEANDKSRGTIDIKLFKENKWMKIEISDNGKGIGSGDLSKIGLTGFSQGKAKGSGLGASSAKEFVESNNGQFNFSSKGEGLGATVCLSFPHISSPEWIVRELTLSNFKNIVIIDDVESVHCSWDNRIKKIDTKEIISIVHHKTFKDCSSIDKESLYIVDYEIHGEKINGVDFILTKHIESEAILSTSYFDDPAVIEKIIKYKLKIIPKDLLGKVKLIV